MENSITDRKKSFPHEYIRMKMECFFPVPVPMMKHFTVSECDVMRVKVDAI